MTLPNRESFFEAVQAFITSFDIEESKRILTEYQDLLLTDTADQIFVELLEYNEGNSTATYLLTEDRTLLRRCREVGIEQAFSEQADSQQIKQVTKAVLIFGNTRTPEEGKRVVEQYQELLLTDEADRVLTDLLVKYAEDFSRVSWLMGLHDLLRRCRDVGIEVAFAELSCLPTPSEQPPALRQMEAMRHHASAISYLERNETEITQSIERAIWHCHQALTILPPQEPPTYDWAKIQHTLASAYAERRVEDRAENLERAIYHYLQALQVFSSSEFPNEWAATHLDIGIAYKNRIRENRANSLEQSIRHYEQALEVYTRDTYPTEWARVQNNLANAYIHRIHGERADNLDRAIEYCNQALEVRTRDVFPEKWAMTQHNLATAYAQRLRGELSDNLEKAIFHYEQALQVRTEESFPEFWAMTHLNLGLAYISRLQGERSKNLQQAITHCEQALKIYKRSAFPQEWASVQNNLAIAYLKANNVEQAIEHGQQALAVRRKSDFPEQWAETNNNLGEAYKLRLTGSPEMNLRQAIAYYKQALDVYAADTFPDNCRTTARNLGKLHFEQQAWAEAASAYTKALQAGENLYQSAILLDGKAVELAETNALPRLAAYALARSGDLQAAVLTLEQGRARGFSETLDRDRANLTQLQQLAPSLYTQYTDTTNQLRNLETQQRLRITSDDRHSLTPEALRSQALQLRETLTKIIDQIRQVPGYEDLLAQPSFDDIRQALRPGIPLVYLVTSPAGSLALIVTQKGIDDLWLDDLTENSLGEIFLAWFRAYYDQSQTNRPAWLAAIEQGTRQLWQPLMLPLIKHLQQNNFQQATLIPTGLLSFLPLHAAWVEDSTAPTGKYYALDAIQFTYVPNARSLSTAQEIAQRTVANSILAIDNPCKDLPNSTREVTAAVATFPQHKVLQHEQAALSDVLAALPHYNVLHLSCHGTANLREPLTSGLAMSDGLLTLRDLLDLKLDGIRLAILSACETGLAGIELADEAISLPTGLLQAGVAGVAASLWSVSDLSTMMLLTRFYDFWRSDNLEIDQALRQAQRWVRDSTNSEKVAYFKASLPEFVAQVKMPAETASFLYKSVLLSNPKARDFAHPFHWAAFHYVGV
ncbi:tetratricopeptide domain protein [Calothrix sp. NIES-2100]|uniref:CHAT domain-containing tetratricopeptide repeat protein n=1 Tax=Calothrix sp. NIES-2100 TaxID=1954172 RepID=UPI000B60E5FC|nr:tetratricopeptide domain protein [Calothrix sp. NIES-2100]